MGHYAPRLTLRSSRWIRAAVVLLALSASPATSQAAAAPDSSVRALPAWLAGHWRMERGGRVVEEHWTGAAGGVMFGVGRTLRDGRLVEFEFVRIETRPGGLAYVAQPKGAPPTEFKLTRSEAGSVRFENPAHDFPQVVRYWTTGSDSLHAEVSATRDGKTSAIRFDYARAGCPGRDGAKK